MSAIAYVRITAKERAAGYPSLKTQEASIREFAEKHNVKISQVFYDDPVGVLPSNKHRGDVCSQSGLFELLSQTTKDWSLVISSTLDRIKRDDTSMNAISEIESQEKRFISIHQKLTPIDEAFLILCSRKNRKVRKRRISEGLPVAERLFLGRVRGAENGYHQSGPAPYGYRRPSRRRGRPKPPLEIREDEADIVSTIFRSYLKLKSMRRVIEHLGSIGSRTRRDKEWSRAGLSWILKNETYLGRVHFGKIKAKGKHEAIISPIIFNKAQALMRKNNKRNSNYQPRGRLV